MGNLKQKPRIFIGIHEIGDYTLRLSQGLRYWGFQVTNVVSELRSPLLSQELSHDRYIRRSENKYVYQLRLINEFIKEMLRNDIFVFNWSQSFTGYLQHSGSQLLCHLAYFDLAVLKALGKKIVVMANGCDVRHYSLAEREARANGYKYHVCFDCDVREKCSLSLKTMKVRKIEKYADYIFSHPLTGYLFSRDFLSIRVPINLATVSFKVNSSPEPLILHAPSNRAIKGTKYLLEAIERLNKEGYQFRFVLCENLDNTEIRNKLSESEIVVDQLLARAYGLFGIEAMASGNVVLGNARAGQYGFPEELPILTTNPDNIYENLKMVLENPQLRVERAHKGRAYVEKYHDHVKVAKDFIRKIDEVEYL